VNKRVTGHTKEQSNISR